MSSLRKYPDPEKPNAVPMAEPALSVMQFASRCESSSGSVGVTETGTNEGSPA